MTTMTQWSYGDRVIHQSRPEWGAGTITKAAAAIHEGKPCQKLTVRFERAGLKTLSTALARGFQSEEPPPEAAEDAFAPRERPEQLFARLPEPARDPFASPEARFEATLNLYRFTPEGGSLLDWAAMQSGLTDPLSSFARPELEALFRRFAQVRDEHLRALAAELMKRNPAIVKQAAASAPPEARAALRRLDGHR
jgi:hypothetical protein